MEPVRTKRVGERLAIWTNSVMGEKFLGEWTDIPQWCANKKSPS